MATMTHDALLDAYARGIRDFRGIKIEPGTEFTRKCLDGADFSGADLHAVAFEFCSLDRTKFREADISWCSFACANLVAADLSGAKAQAACMHKADMTRACLDGADFGADEDTDILRGPADFDEAILSRASAKKTSFFGARMKEADLSHIDATEADFSGAQMHHVDLIGSCIHKAEFRDTELLGRVKLGLAGTQHTDFFHPEDLPEKDREPSIHPDI